MYETILKSDFEESELALDRIRKMQTTPKKASDNEESSTNFCYSNEGV